MFSGRPNHVDTKWGALSPTTPAPLPAACSANGVNDEPEKKLNVLFFVYFLRVWAETWNRLHFFTFGWKQCFYITHSAM